MRFGPRGSSRRPHAPQLYFAKNVQLKDSGTLPGILIHTSAKLLNQQPETEICGLRRMRVG